MTYEMVFKRHWETEGGKYGSATTESFQVFRRKSFPYCGLFAVTLHQLTPSKNVRR